MTIAAYKNCLRCCPLQLIKFFKKIVLNDESLPKSFQLHQPFHRVQEAVIRQLNPLNSAQVSWRFSQKGTQESHQIGNSNQPPLNLLWLFHLRKRYVRELGENVEICFLFTGKRLLFSTTASLCSKDKMTVLQKVRCGIGLSITMGYEVWLVSCPEAVT